MAGLQGIGTEVGSTMPTHGPSANDRPIDDSTLRKVLTCIPVVTFFMQASNGVWHKEQLKEENTPERKIKVFEASIFHEKSTHAANLISIVAIAIVTAALACNLFLILGAIILVAGSSCVSLYRLDHYKDTLNGLGA